MGKKSPKYWIVGVIVILLVGLTATFIWSYDYVNWSETYAEENSLPYGSSIFKKLVATYAKDKLQDLPDSMADVLGTHHQIDQIHNYLFIGRDLYLDSAELASLLEFVAHGNQAFIFSYNFNRSLLDSLLTVELQREINLDIEDFEYEYEYDPSMYSLFYEHSDTSVFCELNVERFKEKNLLECKYVRHHKPIVKSWPYFNPNVISRNGEPMEHLGFFHTDDLNFATVSYGKGKFYLHTTPLAFSNYSLLQKPAFEYVNHVIGLLGDGDVLWESTGRHYTPSPNNAPRNNRGGTDYGHDEGPLAFILTEPAFKWAWYVLIFATFLYFAFGARRKQKIIPVIQPPENSSLEFAETIGRMYRLQKDHRNIVNLKFNLFLQFLRSRYGIRATANIDDHSAELYKRISIVSDIPEAQIEAIFKDYKSLQISMEVSNDQLIHFYQLVEYFHQNCK